MSKKSTDPVDSALTDEVSTERLHVETSEKAGRFFQRLFGNSGAFDFNRSNDMHGIGATNSHDCMGRAN